MIDFSGITKQQLRVLDAMEELALKYHMPTKYTEMARVMSLTVQDLRCICGPMVRHGLLMRERLGNRSWLWLPPELVPTSYFDSGIASEIHWPRPTDRTPRVRITEEQRPLEEFWGDEAYCGDGISTRRPADATKEVGRG